MGGTFEVHKVAVLTSQMDANVKRPVTTHWSCRRQGKQEVKVTVAVEADSKKGY